MDPPPPPASSENGPEVSRISVRAPPFWKENPSLWFRQLESQFITNGITRSSSKYHITVAALETAIITQVSDVILNPPVINMYETLKARLEKHFAESEEHKLKKLLREIDLGDKRPSHLLREMRELAGEKVGEDLLKTLWLQRLPPQIQAILSTSEGTCNKLAELADKISEAVDRPSISAMAAPPRSNNADIVRLEVQISELTKLVSELAKSDRSRATTSAGPSRPRQRSRSRRSHSRSARPRTASAHSSSDALCWYHFKFGVHAKNCRAPCSYNSEN